MAVSSSRGKALARLFQIVTLMYSGGKLTQQDIATVCGCSDRQVRRYLDMLRDAEVPWERTNARGYFLTDNWTPLRLSLTIQEVFALLLARQAVVGRTDQPFVQSAESAFEKIASLLPPDVRKRLAEEDSIANYTSGQRNYSKAPWGQLLAGIQRRERLEMDYYTIGTDKHSTRRIDPYHIVWLRDYCQLIAYCHTRKRVTSFALDCINGLRPTGETFMILDTFSLTKYLEGASGPMLGDPIDISIRFDAEVARYAHRRAWKFPHKLVDLPDGGVELHGTVRGLHDIRKEILAWGRHAFALSPPELRDELLADARALVTLYETT